MVVELMGNTVGWLALGAGIAGGADVILIPEIPYDVEAIASSIKARRAAGSTFFHCRCGRRSGLFREDAAIRASMVSELQGTTGEEREQIKKTLKLFDEAHVGGTSELAATLEEMTGLESRLTNSRSCPAWWDPIT